MTKEQIKLHIFILIVTMALAFAGCAPKRGKPGISGPAGSNGTSCSVVQLANGAEIRCGDNTSAVILNGLPGAHAVVGVITPCFNATKVFQESILVLEGGQLVGHYSHGSKQFLTLLVPGNYETTDGLKCKFTVTAEMNVVW